MMDRLMLLLLRRFRHMTARSQYRVSGAERPPADAAAIATVLLLARAIAASGYTLREIVDILRQPAPIITLTAWAGGFEGAVLRLVETSALVPFGPYEGTEGNLLMDNGRWAYGDGDVRRRFIHFCGKDLYRTHGLGLRRQINRALGQSCPIIAIGEAQGSTPAILDLSADIALHAGDIDSAIIGDLVALFYDTKDRDGHSKAIADIDAAHLSLHDLDLAFRPGRPVEHALSVLRHLAEASSDETGGEDQVDTTAKQERHMISQSPFRADAKTAKSDTRAQGSAKSSGAEIILPVIGAQQTQEILLLEHLSGYGEAMTWALDLKLDLDAYHAQTIRWSDLSTRLLLSGPPGTGKTTFAKALCNSLQVPLVATSVSSWLEGSHLNGVLTRMSRTFEEAAALAPAIVFIDEIDGIGKRVAANHEYADYWNAVVNRLLELLDGTVKTEGIIVIGATNRPQEIDTAVTRAGRLEKHIIIPQPDIDALTGILRHHLKDDLATLAQAIPDHKPDQGQDLGKEDSL
ncbi:MULTISPECIES: AAA family ATPase [unclassified Rhizobium]|uniref:AAA family ATPase n=1 Tax=unclassified Rhizobium TaxID=2613769 RepID=UPI001ADB0F4B|nr:MULTISPECIES: AAA family ATPase [unclassified Rhizobium]MBO9127731.1 ATP-binding protein [Rhizobium sp. 16-488-2b]MBO9178193.1 ATP-binding protein [Rhizobium sp. 16-488-2a]